MCKYFALGILIAISLLVAGCNTAFEYGGPVVIAPDGILSSYAANYVQRGDRIKVSVYGEENLNGVYDVDPAGFVSLPLAGLVRAAGRTKVDIERDITRRYKSDYLQDPKVTVDVVSFRPVYIFGEAERPGEIPYKSGLNVLTAITAAGGPTYRASRKYVLIQHPGEGVWREYPMSALVPIAPGDLIRIPERYF